jgi:Uma2 family endonuclease
MSSTPAEPQLVLGLEHAGILMTPEEFDAIEEYDENYRYELVRGVLVVSLFPAPEEAGPNEALGCWLRKYQEGHRHGAALDCTLPQQYVYTATDRRLADRLIWTGLGRYPNRRRDIPSTVVDFVSSARRDRERDCIEKRHEYLQASVQEYWTFDRFRRMLTVARRTPGGPDERVIREHQTYRTPLLPGFQLPLADLLAVADRWAGAEEVAQ